jgi:hypothetical protein
MPGPLLDKVAANLGSAANGELPPDVVEQIRRHAAEFGVGAGLSGSEFAGNQGLKQLGLTSLARQDYATQASLPFFSTPGLRENQRQFNTNYLFQDQLRRDAQAQQQIAQQARYASAWDAGRSDPWAKTGNTPMMAMGMNYGGGGGTGGAMHAPAAPPPNYSNDIGDFISKYLPGANTKGVYSFQPGDIGDAAPINLDSGVTSSALQPDWGADWDPSTWDE